jgi:hypothetical protein
MKFPSSRTAFKLAPTLGDCTDQPQSGSLFSTEETPFELNQNCRVICTTTRDKRQKQIDVYLHTCSYLLVSTYGPTTLCWASTASFFSFLIFYTIGLFGRGISPSQGRLPAHRAAQTQNKRTQTSMPHVGLEPKIPVFER